MPKKINLENFNFNKEVGQIEPREITDEMKSSYLDYAMSVIVSRALPDVRDGLKPVQRRILYAMHEMGLRHDVKFRKSAAVTGEVLGKFHPHGDISVYEALVRMAQNFSLRYPLVDGQGNFGSIDGDPAASMRYTEARLSSIGEEILTNIEKETVNFRENYDATRQEPVVLPSSLPNLLLNGSFGIAVGMATNIPPHNVVEILNSAIYLIDHPETTTEDLFQFIQGPDFPGGGLIFDKKAIISAYSQGKGTILVRGRAEIEESKKGNYQIIISEIPFQVQKADLVQEFAQLVENKKIEGIKNIADESDKDGTRIVIELKKDASPQKILNALYKYTNLQKNFNLNLLALIDGIQPKILSLSEILNLYLKHKQEVVLRRTKFDLEKAQEKAHILEGLIVAISNIDAVIKTIRNSENREAAKNNLMKKFKLTEKQAIAILEMRLQNLAKLERIKIETELQELKKKIKELKLILESSKKLKELIKKEFQELKEKYQDKRRTQLISSSPTEISEEELIEATETLVILTQDGFIKRVKPTLYRTQQRGGRGIISAEMGEKDIIEHFLVANTLNKLLFFTNLGKVFQCPVWEIPEMSRTSKGRALINFLEIEPHDKILAILSYSKEDETKGEYLLLITKNGIIKKIELSLFKNVRRNGLTVIKLEKNDSLIGTTIINKGDEVMLITKKGKGIRFKEKDLRPMGRIASGIRALKLSSEDSVVSLDSLSQEKKRKYLLIVTEKGYGKKTKINEYRIQKRGGTGIKAARITLKTGEIIFAKIIKDEEGDLIIISQKGQLIRIPLNSISLLGRDTSGTRLIKLEKEDKVASATKI